MLSNARMNKHFWAEAPNTACYLINRSPSIPLNKKTPIEVEDACEPATYSEAVDSVDKEKWISAMQEEAHGRL